MSFLEKYELLNTDEERDQLTAEWLVQNPRDLFRELRQSKPILKTPHSTIVTKYHDVREVLSLDECFTVAAYASKIEPLLGPFLLGGETHRNMKEN